MSVTTYQRVMDPFATSSDEIVRLREWATDHVYPLPRPPVGSWFLGTSEACAMRLPDRYVAPRHAQLLYEAGQWRLRDLGSPAGMRRDGERCTELVLTPGVEIGVGGTTLVAESSRSMALRSLCARVLGWGSDRMHAVDGALRAIRLAAAHRATLVLRGDGDLVRVACGFHRHMLGEAAPFVVCDPRRRNGSASVRSPANRSDCVAAFRAATDGSLCIRTRRLPPDLPELLPLLDDPGRRVQIVVCMDHDTRGSLLPGPIPIEVPPLAIRELELPRIIDEYANDAIAILRTPPVALTDDDRRWVMTRARSLPEIEKATLRLIAIKNAGSVIRAARQLGMAAVSLSRWLDRRVPVHLAPAAVERSAGPAAAETLSLSRESEP